MWPQILGEVFIVLVSLVGSAHGYPNGVGVDPSCSSLVPQHGSAPRTSAPPYNITFTPTTYTAGGTVQVTISSCSNTNFMGFMLQARLADTSLDQTSLMGSFTAVSGTRPACDGKALVHSDDSGKTTKTLTWTAPGTAVGHISFRVTFVQSEHTYWTNIVSDVLNDGSLNGATSTLNSPTVLDVNCTSGASTVHCTSGMQGLADNRALDSYIDFCGQTCYGPQGNGTYQKHKYCPISIFFDFPREIKSNCGYKEEYTYFFKNQVTQL